jgi:hypothetical protein
MKLLWSRLLPRDIRDQIVRSLHYAEALREGAVLLAIFGPVSMAEIFRSVSITTALVIWSASAIANSVGPLPTERGPPACVRRPQRPPRRSEAAPARAQPRAAHLPSSLLYRLCRRACCETGKRRQPIGAASFRPGPEPHQRTPRVPRQPRRRKPWRLQRRVRLRRQTQPCPSRSTKSCRRSRLCPLRAARRVHSVYFSGSYF